MSDSHIVRNASPHSVSVSEGSKVAGGKKPGAAEPSVRNTLVGEEPSPVKHEEVPELTLSPRITPAAAPAAPAMPPAFHSQVEPETGVLLDQRSIQDEVLSLGELPKPAHAAPPTTALLPEILAQPVPQQEAAAPPAIPREASEHRIALPESASTAEEPQAQAPVLERVQQDHRASLPEPLPDSEAQAPTEAPVQMRSAQDQRAQLPESLAEPAGAAPSDAPVLERRQSDAVAAVPESVAFAPTQETEGPIVSRSSSDSVLELPPETAKAEAITEGPLISRQEDEQMAVVPPAEVKAFEPTTGPDILRADNDTLVAVPEASAPQLDAEGPLVKRSENDNRVAVPEAEPRLVSDPDMPPPAAARAELNVPEAPAMQSEYIEIPEIIEVPQEQVQALPAVTQATAELAAPVLRPSEHEMAQMNFPARVIKLKIANDKVRVQLDALEAPERPGR